MKLRSFFYGLVSIVLVLLLTSAIGLYWLTAGSASSLVSNGGKASPAAAMFIPKQAPIVASLLVNPSHVESLRLAVSPPGKRRQVRSELEQFKQSLLSSTRLDYEQDIAPWLGDEITLAVTSPDIDRDTNNGLQPGYLLAAATQDPIRANEFLQLFWQRRAVAGIDLVFEQYAGVRIIYGNQPFQPATAKAADAKLPTTVSPASTLASAIVGDRFVLFANSPKVLRDAINNVQAPGLSLSSSDTYQEALKRLPDRQIGLAFMNLPQLTTWIAGEKDNPDTADSTADRLYDSVVMTLELDRHGLVADTALLTAAGETLKPAKAALSKPVEALKFIPASSPLSAAGHDLRQLWAQLHQGLSGYGSLATLLNQSLSELSTQWQINSSTDLLDWVNGEYAVALLPRPDRPQQDWIFVVEKDADAEAAIERFDAIAKQQGLSTGAFPLGDRQIFAWTKLLPTATQNKDAVSLQAQVQGVHTDVGNYEVFATSLEAINQALQASQNSLLSLDSFAQAIDALNPKNDGYFYIDWLAVRGLLEQRFPVIRLAELAGKPFFEHLRSLTVTSYDTESTVQRGAIFIQLKD
jgi:hypothetical protein